MKQSQEDKIISEFEEVRSLIKNIDGFINFINSYSSQIVYPNLRNPINTEHGCGTFAIIAGHHGILTAAHVAAIFENHQSNKIYIPTHNPDNYDLISVGFKEIIKLPYIRGMASIDLAFIDLSSSQEILKLEKSFYNLDAAKKEVMKGFPEKIARMQCCGFLGAPSDKKKLTEVSGRPIVDYPKGAVFLGDIKKGSYSNRPFYFPKFYDSFLEGVEFRYDEYKMVWNQRYDMPASFKGTSGSSLWGAELQKQDNHFIVSEPILIGVFVLEHLNNKELQCRGGVSIYETFLTYCSSYLNGDDLKTSLLKARVSEV